MRTLDNFYVLMFIENLDWNLIWSVCTKCHFDTSQYKWLTYRNQIEQYIIQMYAICIVNMDKVIAWKLSIYLYMYSFMYLFPNSISYAYFIPHWQSWFVLLLGSIFSPTFIQLQLVKHISKWASFLLYVFFKECSHTAIR